MSSSAPSPTLLPPGSIAAMVRALPGNAQATAAFRDAACAALRLSRARGRAECDALGLVFEALISDDRRTLILDLLASAGTPEAQIVMRRLLALGIARRDSRTFATFVQRLGFVERPDTETLRFLMSVYAESKYEAHDVRAACAYALGGGAGRAHVWGLIEPAIRASEVLRRDLLVATSTAEKCALVTALGHAGLDTDVGVILRFVEDQDARVRSTAALALRKMHTSEARLSLLSLLPSTDRNLAESALSALFEQSLTQEEIVRLAELVLAGRTPIALDGRILRLIVTQKLSPGPLPGPGCPEQVVEDAVHLLLSRIEAQALRGSDAPSVDPQGGLARRAAGPRRVPMPKTPLPYSAGYRMVTRESGVPEAVPEIAPEIVPEIVDQPAAVAPEASGSNLASRRPVTPGLAATMAYGSASDALRMSVAGGTEVRSMSAFSVACPVVPLAILR